MYRSTLKIMRMLRALILELVGRSPFRQLLPNGALHLPAVRSLRSDYALIQKQDPLPSRWYGRLVQHKNWRRSPPKRTRNKLFLSGLLTLSAGLGISQTQSPTMNFDQITKTIELDGDTFPFYDYGAGTPVLLLHGFPDSKFLWRHQLQPLADAGYRVIVPDLLGYGGASKPAEVDAYALPNILEDLTGLLDALSVDQAHIVGHDWGGTVAWLLAGTFPTRCLSVTGMTVGAPGGRGRRDLDQLEKLWYVFFFQNEGIAEEWLRRDDWQGLRAWTREKGDFDHYRQMLDRPGALTGGLNWYRANFSPASLNKTSNPPRITVPAMGLTADGDTFLLEKHVRDCDNMIDGPWTYHRVEGASHWLMLDQPEVVNRLLIDFLAKAGNN